MVFLTMLGGAVLRGQGVPRATPVEDPERLPVPKAVPIPSTRAPRPEVVTDGATPAPATDASKSKGPDDDLFEFAMMSYERKEYELAAQSFAQYLQRYSGGRQVAMALFRLGECYVSQNQAAQAEPYFLEVVSRYPSSEGAPAAAYRLGAIRFNGRQFEESAKYFGLCEAKTKLPEIRLVAAYNKSRAYQMLGDRKRMMAALETVAGMEGDNPYRETALLSLATALLAEDKKAEALKMFQDLIKVSKDGAVRADALVKAAVIEAETGEPEEALKHFDEALRLPETTKENREVALVGGVQAMFAKGDYNAVIDTYNRNAHILPPGELGPKLLLLVGHAHRLRKNYARAVELYIMVEQHHGGTPQAFEAGYWKLFCFYLLGEKQLPEFAEGFLQRYASGQKDHQFIMLARLILADAYFNQQKYKESARAFTDLQFEKISAKIRPDALFNKGWAEAECGQHQYAINTLTRFLAENEKHSLTAKAIARRGLSYREVRDFPHAQADFARVIEEFSKSDAAELAFLQKGLIHSELREVKEMIAAFEMLLEKFPDTQAAAQACFFIGRGYYEQKQFDKAVPALERAKSKDPKVYLDKVSPMIVLSHYLRQDVDGLTKAIDAYREANTKAVIPPDVLTFAGVKLQDKGEFMKSSRFLGYAVDAYGTGNVPAAVWNFLGIAHLETKAWDASIKAMDEFLAVTPESPVKARGLLTKSRALAGLGKFDEAIAAAGEGLRFVKDGKLQAQLMIQEGDILTAQGDALGKASDAAGARAKWTEAAGKYVVPSQVFVDPVITPEALSKAADVLEKAGENAKAEDLRKQLRERYPDYVKK